MKKGPVPVFMVWYQNLLYGKLDLIRINWKQPNTLCLVCLAVHVGMDMLPEQIYPTSPFNHGGDYQDRWNVMSIWHREDGSITFFCIGIIHLITICLCLPQQNNLMFTKEHYPAHPVFPQALLLIRAIYTVYRDEECPSPKLWMEKVNGVPR